MAGTHDVSGGTRSAVLRRLVRSLLVAMLMALVTHIGWTVRMLVRPSAPGSMAHGAAASVGPWMLVDQLSTDAAAADISQLLAALSPELEQATAADGGARDLKTDDLSFRNAPGIGDEDSSGRFVGVMAAGRLVRLSEEGQLAGFACSTHLTYAELADVIRRQFADCDLDEAAGTIRFTCRNGLRWRCFHTGTHQDMCFVVFERTE